jgi:hypothetical protein
MTYLRIDFAAMAASRQAYSNMRSMLEGATGALSDGAGSTVKQEYLPRRLEDLHGSWGGGVDRLARYAEDAGAGLEGILEAFQGLDTELGKSMVPQEGSAA